MEQIIEYYFFIILLPALLGIAMRIGLQRSKRSHMYTGLSLLLAVVMWMMSCFVPNHGSEGDGILALICSTYAMGMIFVEISIYILKKWRNR